MSEQAVWYYSLHGKAQGPVTPTFICDSLKSGRLTLVDLVYRHGDDAWHTLGEFPEFREAYGASAPVAPHHYSQVIKPDQVPKDWTVSPSWIILVKTETGFTQNGPFTHAEIFGKIAQGEIRYSQYAWKPGYRKWKRLGDLPEFDRRRSERKNDPLNQILSPMKMGMERATVPTEDLLQNVVRFDRNLSPSEVDDGDLTSVPVPFAAARNVTSLPSESAYEGTWEEHIDEVVVEPVVEAAVEVTTEVAAPMKRVLAIVPQESFQEMPHHTSHDMSLETELNIEEPSVETQAVVLPFSSPVKAEATVRKPARLFFAGLCAAVAVFFCLQQISSRKQVAKPNKTTESVVAKKPHSTTQASTLAPEPKILEIVGVKLTSSTPSLLFQTDVAVGEKIAIDIRSLESDSSYKGHFEVLRGAGEVPTLNLSGLNLAEGKYQVNASTRGLHKSIEVALGVNEAHLDEPVDNKLKASATERQAERKALFYSARHYQHLLHTLTANFGKLKSQPDVWREFLANWTKEYQTAGLAIQVLVTDPEIKLIYPKEIAAFRTSAAEVAERARDLDVAVTQKREVAGISSGTLEKDLARFRTKAAQMALEE